MAQNDDTALANLQAQHDELKAKFDEAQANSAEQAKRIETLEADLKSTQASLRAQKGVATKAKAAASELAAQAKPRNLGPINQDVDLDELELALADAETVEIAFSDGKREIKGLGSRQINGEGWKRTGRGIVLDVPSMTVEGPQPGQPPFRVAGYALLIDGEQVAYAPAMDPRIIASGQRHELKDDVVFG